MPRPIPPPLKAVPPDCRRRNAAGQAILAAIQTRPAQRKAPSRNYVDASDDLVVKQAVMFRGLGEFSQEARSRDPVI
jgi:hypothetical protein